MKLRDASQELYLEKRRKKQELPELMKKFPLAPKPADAIIPIFYKRQKK